MKTTDISLNLPSEYFDTLSVVMEVGLKHAAINPLLRNELRAWWTAESELIREERDSE